MPSIVITVVRALMILVIQLIGFFFFYNHPHGRHAVYHTWYASVIDALAIFSGSSIMFASIYALENPDLFTIDIPSWIMWTTFVIGSWQAAIHLVKIVIRRRNRRAANQ